MLSQPRLAWLTHYWYLWRHQLSLPPEEDTKTSLWPRRERFINTPRSTLILLKKSEDFVLTHDKIILSSMCDVVKMNKDDQTSLNLYQFLI